MKKWIRRILILIKTFLKYGFSAMKKRFQHFRDENAFSLEEIQALHLVSNDKLEEQKKTDFQRKIKFSIITPLFNTPEKFLKELIESLESQTYSNWELCLADGSDSDHKDVRRICLDYASKDSRIIYHQLKENKGISENTNECLKLASGDFYGLLDHDDLLHPSALYEVCKAINEKNADFLYTDEVKFSDSIYNIKDLKSFNLKPGFGIDDLRSHNYICHFTVFDKNLLLEEKCFYRSEFDGSQDHDMVLRLTEKAKRIVHINKVLYYWRLHSNSVSMNLDVKSYAVDAAINAISDQLKRQNESGTVMSSAPFRTIYKVEYPVNNTPLISIVLWNITTFQKAKEVVDIIKKYSSYQNLEYIYLSQTELNETNHEIHYSYSDGNISQQINNAVNEANGDYVLLLNGNIKFLTSHWIQEMLMHAQRSRVCSVGAKIYNKDGSVFHGGVSLDKDSPNYLYFLGENNYQGEIGYEGILSHVRNVTANAKDCLMIKKSIWDNIGGFSIDLPGYCDIDFCLKGEEAGLRNIWVPYSEIFLNCLQNRESINSQSTLFYNCWKDTILNDEHSNRYWKKNKLV